MGTLAFASARTHVGSSLPQLARRAVAGEAGALERLLGELQPLIVRTARLVVGPGSWAAEDAAQEAMIDVQRGIGRLREPEAVHAWALRIATARALKIARRERLLSLRRAPPDDAELTVTAPDARTTELKAAFYRLPPRMRAVAVLRLHVGLSEAETAAILKCSTGTVKSQLHDARGRLAAALESQGIGPSTGTSEEERP